MTNKEIETGLKEVYALMEDGNFEASFERLKYLEPSSDGLVLYLIGYMLYTGKGVEQIRDEGVVYMIKSAKTGYKPAKDFLNNMQKASKKLASKEEIDQVLDKASKGDTKSKYKYAMMCMKGQVENKGKAEATKYFTEAASEGHTLSMIALFNRYYIDKDFEPMWSRAHYWFSKACENDKDRVYIIHPEIIDAQALINQSLEQVDKEIKKELIEKAIEKKHYGAYKHLGDLLEGEKAIEAYETGASYGDCECALKLKECYEKGINTDKDENNAFFWENEYLRLKQYIGK